MSNFMWGWQQPYQRSIESAAKRFFFMIDPNLTAEVFLLGLSESQSQYTEPVCFEPEDCGYVAENFSEIHSLAKQLANVDESVQIGYSDENIQKKRNEAIISNGYKTAVEKTLRTQHPFDDNELYVSLPYEVASHIVFIVLIFPRNVIERHFSLHKTGVDHRSPLSRSFIESAIDVYLAECRNSLKDLQYSDRFVDRAPEELLRSSGRHFMNTIERDIECQLSPIALFDAFNNVSFLKYEGSDSSGQILLAKSGHSNVKLTLRLSQPISLTDSRKVRKFLELSDHASSIVSDGEYILGLGIMRGKYNPKDESLFFVNFNGHYKWELTHDGHSLLSVAYGLPKIRTDEINRNQFSEILSRVFTGISVFKIDQLWDITLRATQQKHGTMLVISSHANEEASRLAGQCFKLESLPLTEDLIIHITSIDGAVILDSECICYAIGAILDGVVSESKGDSSRGARYNSAIRYFETNKTSHSIVIVIVSEDGMIDLVPNLRPKINRDSISEAINALRQLLEEPHPTRSQFSKRNRVIEGVAFYLNEEQCKLVNELRIEIQKKLDDSLNVIYSKLIPSPEMNESYFN